GFDTVIFDTSARALAEIARDELPAKYRRALLRQKYGNGVAKVDYVLDGPIPWRDDRVHGTATVHLGGSREETAHAENEVARGRHADHPYVLLAQPDAFDTARNPQGTHAIWSYTHVPHGSAIDVTEQVTRQIERFAPGVRDRIVASHITTAAELSRYNPNYVGGDISSGAVTLAQLIARRTRSAPRPRAAPPPRRRARRALACTASRASTPRGQRLRTSTALSPRTSASTRRPGRHDRRGKCEPAGSSGDPLTRSRGGGLR